MDGDAELLDLRLREAYEERLHPRDRSGRYVRVFFKDKRQPVILRVSSRGITPRRIEGTEVDAKGETILDDQYVATDHEIHPRETSAIQELTHQWGTDDETLVPRDELFNGPAKEHLDLLFGGDHPWVEALSQDEKDALLVYIRPDGFQAINNGLRSGNADTETYNYLPPDGRHRRRRTVASWTALLDSAMAKAPPTDVNLRLHVYRGIRDMGALFGPGGPKVGDRFTDAAFVSTTTDAEIARNFAERPSTWAPDASPDPGVVEISVPEGVRAAWMKAVIESQPEVTLPRGQTYEITDVYPQLGAKVGESITHVEMKLVQPKAETHDDDTAEVTPEQFRAIFDGFEHDGLKVKLSEAKREGKMGGYGVRYEAKIRDGRKNAGEVRRVFTDAGEGREVQHEALWLKDDYRGRGFAAALNAHAEAEYRKLGVERIKLSTTSVGGYAWTRDFDFDWPYYTILAAAELGPFYPEVNFYERYGDEKLARAFAVQRLWREREPSVWKRVKAAGKVPPEMWDEFARKSQIPDSAFERYLGGDEAAFDGHFQSPAELATFGREHRWSEAVALAPYSDSPKEVEVWLGKRYMLGTSWRGVKEMGGDGIISEATVHRSGRLTLQEIARQVHDERRAEGNVQDADDGLDPNDVDFWDEVQRRFDDQV